MSESVIVSATDVERIFDSGGQRSIALRGINLDVKKGEFVAIMGRSGSGKTTVAQQIAARLEIEHIELDALAQQSGWKLRPAEEFRSDLQRRLSGAEQGLSLIHI